MQCSECGYMMTAFDKDCPRCKVLTEKQKEQPDDTKLLPQLAQAHLPKPRRDLQVETEPHPAPELHRPMRVVSPEPIASQPPVVSEPAPLIIYQNRPLNWKPYAAAATLLLVLVGVYTWYRMTQDAATRALVLAARQGACQRMPGFDTDREQDGCVQLAGALHYTIAHTSDSQALVTFFLNGVTNSLAVQMNKDENGDWHAVAAKEGDEGSRRDFDRTAEPVWVHRDPPPTDGIGGPTVPDTPSQNTTPPDPVYSSPPSVPDNSSTPDTSSTPTDNSAASPPDYTMRTKAGGGTSPDTSGFNSN